MVSHSVSYVSSVLARTLDAQTLSILYILQGCTHVQPVLDPKNETPRFQRLHTSL
jgi:hypothetical protein